MRRDTLKFAGHVLISSLIFLTVGLLIANAFHARKAFVGYHYSRNMPIGTYSTLAVLIPIGLLFLVAAVVWGAKRLNGLSEAKRERHLKRFKRVADRFPKRSETWPAKIGD